jgi:hypothetical protein
MFNGEPTVSYWTNDYANMINGTDSTIWHPDTTVHDQVYIFTSDLCRSLGLKYSETRRNTFGVKTHRFILPENTFANIPENRGFCLNSTNSNKTHDIQCLPSGLMSLKSCIKCKFLISNQQDFFKIICLVSGSSVSIPLPIIASSPHFLDAAPSVQNGVQGLQPDSIKHRSFMDIEPITGSKYSRVKMNRE